MTDMQERLQQLGRQCPQIGDVSVVFADDQQQVCASFRRDGADHGVASAYASCVAKLFTSTLWLRLVAESRVQMDELVETHLPIGDPKARRAFAGIRLADLANHSHGLDDSALGRIPLSAHATIDIATLCHELASASPLARPGEMYSYGSAGAWLMGAVLERVHGQPFRKILERELLEPLQIEFKLTMDPQAARAVEACPATGGRWLLSARDVAALLIQHLGLTCSSPGPALHGHVELMLSREQGLIGWNPMEKAINCGWKNYGNGWYGHDGRGPQSSLLARINTRERRAIAISCTGFPGGDPVYLVLARLFADVCPELVAFDAPELLDPHRARSIDRTAYVGRYENRGSAVVVRAEQDDLFLTPLRLAAAREPAPAPEYRLRPAEQDIFMTFPAEPEVFSYLQFVRPSGGRFDYLWNGQNLWRRAAS